MNPYLKPWVLVVTGILFNIASAVITHYFIGLNNRHLNELETQSARYDTLIDSQWRTRTEIQRKREFLLLLLTQPNAATDMDLQQLIRRQLEGMDARNPTLPAQASADIGFETVEKTSQRISQEIIDSINDTYLEKLDLQQKMQPLQEKNSLLFSVSIFLQLTGLILVLAKDIFR